MKINISKKCYSVAFTLLSALFIALPALADDTIQVFENHSQQGLSFQTQGEVSRTVLTVAGDDGIVFNQDLGTSQNLSYPLQDQDGNPLPDGDYRYQFVAVGVSVAEASKEPPIARNSGLFSIIDVELVFPGDEQPQD